MIGARINAGRNRAILVTDISVDEGAIVWMVIINGLNFEKLQLLALQREC